MLTPVRFAELAIKQGTVGVVTDPHEIANVLGVAGIKYMVDEAERTALKIKFGIPSCVPATPFETSGAEIGSDAIEELFREDTRFHLAEMMNYPGVIYGDKEVMKKIEAARRYGRIIDGHAPGVRGAELKKYVKAGVVTDHECTDLSEAREKIGQGMKILIREGSAAKNFEELVPLVEEYPDEVMFCTDDSHPDDLAERHINDMVRRAVEKGYDLWDVLKAVIINPAGLYGLNTGLLRKGDAADMIVVEDLKEFRVKEVYLDGVRVYDGKDVKSGIPGGKEPNRFVADPVNVKDIAVKWERGRNMRVIVAKDGSLVTGESIEEAKIEGERVVSDPERDILKIVVMNRYSKGKKPVTGFINGFGMKSGAIASSIAHDSHNIVAVGVEDDDIVSAMNAVIAAGGGIAVSAGGDAEVMSLPVAGLMTNEEGEVVAKRYKEINEIAERTGTDLRAPFMTLSFMALLVIPELKIGDKGLFDVRKFSFTELFV
jgi:adenine deaminase